MLGAVLALDPVSPASAGTTPAASSFKAIKAARSESQKANLDALGTQLDDTDRAGIAALPKDQRFVRPPFAPEWDAIG
jgi:hypothetical protein